MRNEEGNVVALLEELHPILSALGRCEVIVVDDGSTDGTWRILQQERARHGSWVRGVRLERNCGQSAAMWAGLTRAAGRILVTMDGDLQNDPADIPRLLEALARGADVCLTYRVNRRDTWFKKVQSRIGNGLRNRVLGSRILDTGSQLRAFHTRCLSDLPVFDGMHRFMGNLFLMRGWKVAQIPTHHRRRRQGRTKYGLGNRALRGLWDLIGMRWLSRRQIHYSVRDGDK